MAKFLIEINLDNDAFEQNENAEIARILDSVSDLLKKDEMPYQKLLDVNGNSVGIVKMTK